MLRVDVRQLMLPEGDVPHLQDAHLRKYSFCSSYVVALTVFVSNPSHHIQYVHSLSTTVANSFIIRVQRRCDIDGLSLHLVPMSNSDSPSNTAF